MSKTKFTIGALDGLQEKLEKTLAISDIKNINIDLLVPSEENIPPLTKMDELIEDIEEHGLYHNLLVKENEEGKYKIISGHRRYKALLELGIKDVPCKIIDKNIPDVDVQIMMIQANITTRDEDEVTKRKQIVRLEELLKQKKKNGEKIKGKIRDRVGEVFNINGSQVQKYTQVDKKLIPELQELLDTKQITLSKAYNFSSYSEEQQLEIYNLIIENLDNKDQVIKELSNELSKKSDKIKNIENVNANLTLQINDLKNDIKLKEDKLLDIDTEIENIKEEIIRDTNNKNEKELNTLNEQLKRLKKEKNQVSIEKEIIKNELSSIKNTNETNEFNKEMDIKIKVVANGIKELISNLEVKNIDKYTPSEEVKTILNSLKKDDFEFLLKLLK